MTIPASWPEDAKAACDSFVNAAVHIFERYRIAFPGPLPDPVAIAKGYLAGTVTAAECSAQADEWSRILYTPERIRDVKTPSVLATRLALILLSCIPDRASDLSLALEWLLEYIKALGHDTGAAVEILESHFAKGRP
jgi:hypothetical protein